MPYALRIIIQLVLAGIVLLACLIGIDGAGGMLERMSGIDLSSSNSELSFLQLLLVIVCFSIGAILGGVGAMAFIMLLIFKYPELGQPLFAGRNQRSFLKTYRMLLKLGGNAEQYARAEINRIKNLDDSDGDI